MSNINKNSLLSRARVARLGKGIHEDVVITKIDIQDRKRNGILIKKMLYVTFAKLDAETGKRKSEVELSWFRLDHTSEYLFSNMRELAIQLHGILKCYMTEDEAFDAMEGDIDGLDFEAVDDMENHKWKKAEVEAVMADMQERFAEVMKDKIGLDSQKLRVKITTDNKGEGANIPSYGVFTESMEVAADDTKLRFSDNELKNHSKAGNVSTNSSASTAIKSI
jgi:hypothetical protein